MARPNRSDQRREQWVPVIAKAFAELGYRRATTAALADRCGLRENQLYRVWPSKKAMFLASIDYLYEVTATKWRDLLACGSERSPAERILQWEGEHRGESGLHRITFAGLNETDDPDIRAALRDMYQKFHALIITQVVEHRADANPGTQPDAELTAWAILGLGVMTNIAHELTLLPPDTQGRMVREVGVHLLNGKEQGG